MKISFYKYALLSMVTSSAIVYGQPSPIFFEAELDQVLAAATAIPHQEAGQQSPLPLVEADSVMAPPINAGEEQANHDILPIPQDNPLTQAMGLAAAPDTPPPSGGQAVEGLEEFVFPPHIDLSQPSAESDESSDPLTSAEAQADSPLVRESLTLGTEQKKFVRERNGAVSGTSDLSSPESEAPSRPISGTDSPDSPEASAQFVPDEDADEADERLLQAKWANQAHASHSTSSLSLGGESPIATQAQPSQQAVEGISETGGAVGAGEASQQNEENEVIPRSISVDRSSPENPDHELGPNAHQMEDSYTWGPDQGVIPPSPSLATDEEEENDMTDENGSITGMASTGGDLESVSDGAGAPVTPPEPAAQESQAAETGDVVARGWRRWLSNAAACFGCLAFFRGSRS